MSEKSEHNLLKLGQTVFSSKITVMVSILIVWPAFSLLGSFHLFSSLVQIKRLFSGFPTISLFLIIWKYC